MSWSRNGPPQAPLPSPLDRFAPLPANTLQGGTALLPWQVGHAPATPAWIPGPQMGGASAGLPAPAIAQSLAHVLLSEADLLRLVGQKSVAAGTRQADIFAELVAAASCYLWFFKLTENGRRLSHFLAQCCIESVYFKGNQFLAYFKDGKNIGPRYSMEESFAYTDLANLRTTFSAIGKLPVEDAKKLVSTAQSARRRRIDDLLKLPKDKQPKEFADKTAQQLYDQSDLDEQAIRETVANTAYSNTGNSGLGNGSAASGEGYKYRGRGIIQITGKANYESAGKDLKVDFVSNPDLVLEPFWSVRTAVWFWEKHGLNDLADTHAKGEPLDIGDCDKITAIINPGMKHAAERRAKTKDALGIWGSMKPQ